VLQQFGTEKIGLIGAAASVMEWLIDVAALVVAETADGV
jgi:hypothetical protein